MSTPPEPKEPLWRPESALVRGTASAKFINRINTTHGCNLKSYDDLHRWSTGSTTFQTFWTEAYKFFELSPKHHQHIGPVIEGNVGTLFPPSQFFPEARLNVAEYILRRGEDEAIAIHFVREGIPGVENVTWRALRERTRAMQDAMISCGVKSGDVVAAVISNSVNSFVICLAALSIGAVWSSASCDFGLQGIVDRFSQVKPKVVFADDGYVYNGKMVMLSDRIEKWSHLLTGQNLSAVVVVPHCQLDVNISRIHHGERLDHFLIRGIGRFLRFEYLPFHHPGFILYSSGTTGPPKCIVHSTGGVLLKVKTDSVLQHDMRTSDVAFQFTTTAWVMWVLNFINLSSAKSLFLYDGSPFYPTPTVLLDLSEELSVSIFGTSPRYLSEIKARGILPKHTHGLKSLRSVTSTGAVLSADTYNWFYKTAFPPEVHLISMSGGTDIAGSFVGGTPLLPVYAGEIQAKALGMDVDIYDASSQDGTPVSTPGLPGELVCKTPFPSQPIQFFGPGGHDRYRKSYFERYGNTVWAQGDFIQMELDTRGLLMLGRSDGVLNPSGVRFGSAEIYAVAETFSELSDSICVGQRRDVDDDERVLLFVKMAEGFHLDGNLRTRLKGAIRQKYSTRHVPKYIFEVSDIPITVNGKKCETNVKQIVSGRQVAISGTVANPESLAQFYQFKDLPVEGASDKLKVSKL